MQPRGYKVKPLSVHAIRLTADYVRSKLGIQGEYVDILRVCEHKLTEMGLIMEICPASELWHCEAEVRTDLGEMRVREDVYLDAVRGDGRARFTIAHEVGHLVLHDPIPFGRGQTGNHKIYEDTEWQADTFAAEFLMPAWAMSDVLSVSEIVGRFGVSQAAAEIRFKKFKR